MNTSTTRMALACALAFQVAACGGGGADPGNDAEETAAPPAAINASLPPISHRYVRLEGRARLLSDPAGRSFIRWLFETGALSLCNELREVYGQPRQVFPASVLEAMDNVVEENMYDAATGAARSVRYGPASITLTDREPAAAAGRAPDCLAHTVQQPVRTTIWSSDGYRYEIRLGSPGSAGTARRFSMGHPDDLNWRVLPTDLSAQPRRTIAGASCRDFPVVEQALGGVTEQCRLEPDDNIVFRNLPLVLRDVTLTAMQNGASTAASEEHTLTATRVSTDRTGFGEWADQPVDTLPALPPGVTLTTR